MKEELENGQLQTIRVHEKDVQWMDKHEIWINNKMFDISSKKLEEGIYTFTGLYDEKETELVELEKNKHSHNPEQASLLSLIFKCIPGFFIEQNQWYPSPYTHQYPSSLPVNLLYGYQKIIVPPPRS